MKIVAPRHLLLAARRAPDLVTRALADLERRQAPAPGEALAEVLDDQRVLGVEADGAGVALRFLAEVAPAASLGALPPLASLAKLELLRLGVPADLIVRVQGVRRLAELDAVGLLRPVAARVRFRLLQLAPQLLPPPAHPDRAANDRDHLDRYLRGQITDLMLQLHPSQQRIVQLDGSGAIVVRGVAGSGKTAVALHRVHRLLQQRSLLGGPRLLFITFNRALAAIARQLLPALGLRPDDLEITTLHGHCRTLVPAGRLIQGATRRAHLQRARAQVQAAGGGGAAIWNYPDAFWAEEISLIKTRITAGLDEYLGLRRHGAARPLDTRGRTFVFQVLDAYDRICAAAAELDFDELVRRAYLHLAGLGEQAPRYDHVLVDEAQDFPVLGLRLAALLARPPGHVFLAYDPAQSLYQRGFRWKDGGIVVRGARSIDLSRNFRNTREILESARPLLAGTGAAGADGDLPLEPEPATRGGPPVVRLGAAAGHEMQALIADLRQRIERGLAIGSVAILARRNRDLIGLERALTQADIAVLRHSRDAEIRLADPSAKLLTFHSAKGLEFPVVYVFASSASLGSAGGEGDRTSLQRLLYVAMTRAVHALVMVTTEGAEPAFLRPARPLAPV